MGSVVRRPPVGLVLDRTRRALAALPRRVGETRTGVLLIGRIISPVQRELLRRTHGRLSLTGRAPVLLLTTTGRRTGEARTVPVFYLRDGHRLVVCNVNPGFEHPNPWTLNLRSDPDASVEIHGVRSRVRGRPATEEEIARFWPQLVALWPAYRAFAERGGTRSVFVLEPVGTESIGA